MLNTFALLLAFGFTTPAPQSSPRPQFGGAWVLDKTGLSPDGPRPFWIGCIWQCEIVQTDTELLVTPKDGSTRTFEFGGQPETTSETIGGRTIRTTRSARWDGSTLVVSQQTGSLPPTVTVLSLENGRLIAVTTRTDGRGGGGPIRSLYLPARSRERISSRR